MWPALIAALVSFFGPLLLQWFTDHLKKLPPDLGPVPASEAVAVAQVFAAVRAQMGWLDWLRGRTARLDRLERIATVHATDFLRAAKGAGPVPQMTKAEVELAQM